MALNEQITITLTGQDNISRTFVAIGQSATRASKSITDGSAKANQSLDAVEKNTAETSRQFDKLTASTERTRRSSVSFGVSIGAIVGGLSLAGGAALNQSRQITALELSYKGASDEIIGFTEDLQKSTIFSDESARQAAITAATLARNYGFTAEEVKKVIQVSADLASVTGFGLEDATQRVTAALRGEAEAAEALGLTMNQTAIDKENLTLTMTNQEAAQFRLNALMEQAAFAEGAAAERANTLAGQTQQLVNRVQDAASGFGFMLGPAGEVLGVFSQLALSAPLLGAGFSMVTKSMVAARAASLLLTAATGPLGLVLAATAAVGALILLRDETESVGSISEITTDHVNDLSDALNALYTSGAPGAMISDAEELNSLFESVSASAIEAWAAWDDTFKRQNQEIIDAQASGAEVDIEAIIAKYDAEREAIKNTILSVEELAAVEEDLNVILTDTRESSAKAREEAIALFESFRTGKIGPAEFVAEMDRLAHSLDQYEIDAAKATYATEAFASSAGNATIYMNELWRASHDAAVAVYDLGVAFTSSAGGAEVYGNAIWRSYHDASEAIEEQTDQVVLARGQERGWADEKRKAADARVAATQAEIDAQKALQAEQQKTIMGYAGALGLLPSFSESIFRLMDSIQGGRARGGDSIWTKTADFLDQSSGVATMFRVIVGGTEAMGRGSQDIADWADSLTDATDGLSKADDLLARGVITQREYNALQRDAAIIGDMNVAIQNDLLGIQVRFSDWFAKEQVGLATYIDELGNMSEEQQIVALGFMDGTEAMKAQNALMLANAAAMGELGENGMEAAEAIIAGAVRADPILGEMLESMGLIERGANGEIRVNFPNARSLTDSIDRLTYSIQRLIDEMLGIPTQIFTSVHVGGIDQSANDLQRHKNNINNVPTYRNTTLNTTYTTSGVPPRGGFIGGYATGGVVWADQKPPLPIPQAANGRAVMVGEAGPEIAFLPGGSYVMPHGASKSAMSRGGGNDINVYGPVYVRADDPAQFARQLNARLRSGVR